MRSPFFRLAFVPWKKLRPGNRGSLTDISYDPGGWPGLCGVCQAGFHEASVASLLKVVHHMEGKLACENVRAQCPCKNKWSTCGAFGWRRGLPVRSRRS